MVFLDNYGKDFWGIQGCQFGVSYSAVGFVLNVAFILVLLLGFIIIWILVFEILFGDSQLLHQSLSLIFFLLDGVLKLHGFVSQLPYLQFYPMLFSLYIRELLLLRLLYLNLSISYLLHFSHLRLLSFSKRRHFLFQQFV